MSSDSVPASSAAGAAPRRLFVGVRRLPWIRPLAADYVDAFDTLAGFFAGNPGLPEAWALAIARRHAHARPCEAMAAVLVQQQRRRGAPRAAIAAAEQLADPRAVAVVTGQQAGLFGGPLYTLLKAVTAIQLAERIARDHRVPARAVFWIDAEDHDWDEVQSCAVLDGELARRRLSLGRPAGAGERPVAWIPLDESASAAITALGELLPATEFSKDLLADLGRMYAPGTGTADAFGRWLEAVLGNHGLVVYDASDPAAKPLAGHVFVSELENPGSTLRLAAEAGVALGRRGYHAQVASQTDGVAVFSLDAGRQPIRAAGSEFVIGATALSRAALAGRAREHPESFSPNVLLRPIVQDTLFPTVAYVPGPNELAYLAQLKAVYERFGVPMPLFFPRASATLVDSAAMKFLSRYPLPFEELQPDNEALLNRLLQSRLPSSVEQACQDAAASIDSGMAALIDAVPAIDPTLSGAARSTLGRMQHDLQALHAKIVHAAKRRDETLRRQFHRTRAQAFPDGIPQERGIGFVYFLNKYGPALVDRLLEDLPLDPSQHWILSI